eukprot:TRINITY_DN1893_c0_g1_i1.p1 TRINITY_DN1893_c0_g1~~TRINITY_DN1893_c0_g1_i1.p1  ORF type:complete len:454 (-),score=69.74 TRINITY_DN1893_c0_g1_i1:89-1336(-)
MAAPPIERYAVKAEEELRVQVESGTIQLTVVKGNAELFGAELPSDKQFTFHEGSMAFFSWKGCSIEIKGVCHCYTATETPMVQYLNVHAVLQKRREEARRNGTEGPRVMVVGGVDVGKSTICKLLCNYAARKDENVTYVDLDIGQGSITVPGMFAAIPISKSMDIERGFEDEQPIVFFYGDTSPSSNVQLYKKQVRCLASAIAERENEIAEAKSAGQIINTCGWVEGLGYKLLLDSIEAFNPDVLLVVSQERLYNDLKKDLGETRDILKMPKSGGVVSRDPGARKRARARRIKDYFYGRRQQLSPSRSSVPVGRLNFFQVRAVNRKLLSALPLGSSSTFDPLVPSKISPSVDFVTKVFGVSRSQDTSKLLESPLAGFIVIQSFDSVTKIVQYLKPLVGNPPCNNYLLTKLPFIDQ